MRISPLAIVASAFLTVAAPAVHAADFTIQQVHAAAAAGHADEALNMMGQVLKDHPKSAKAHYVEAELYAHQHQFAEARSELATAQQLAPGLPFANAHSVTELKQQLSANAGTGFAPAPGGTASGMHLPWGLLLVLGLAIAALFAFFRRRQQPAVAYPVSSGGWGAQPGYGSQGGPWGAPPPSGGMGSGILGGLATGAAMGAGFAAGEQIVDRMFGGGERERLVERDGAGTAYDPNVNQDMGGDDFGISDDSSWDDNSGGSDDGW